MKSVFTIFLVLFSIQSFSKVLIQFPKIEVEKISEKELNVREDMSRPIDTSNPLVVELRAGLLSTSDASSEEERSIASSGKAEEAEKKAEKVPEQIQEKIVGNSVEKVEKKEEKHKEESSHHVVGIAPDESLRWLKNGNKRFTRGFLRADGISKKDRERLTKGQKPHAIVYSCSDSRVPAEIVFDQKLGEIFSVRSAGQAIDDTELASIEYALEHLGSKLIVVMGHTSCGAVKAAYETLGGKDAGSPSLNKLVADIQPRIKDVAKETPSKDFEIEVWSNASKITEELVKRSEIIRKHVESGEVKIVPAIYHLDSGVVDWDGK